MKDSIFDDLFVVVIFAVIFILIGFMIGEQFGIRDTKREAIYQGFAQYNSTNANFEWKTNYFEPTTPLQ